MSKAIEEAADEYADNAYYPAPDYGWYESDDEQMEECLADAFKAGAAHLMSLPLAFRMAAEEKERVRKEYRRAYSESFSPTSCLDRQYARGRYQVLREIFGSDFFKEGE